MKISKPSRKEHHSSKANITSLIDIALSLVIFFIVTLPAMLESGIFVKAPGVEKVSGGPSDEFKVSIYLKQDGTYYLNDEQVATKETIGELKDAIGQRIEELLMRSTSKLVIVKADGEVSHGAVVEMLDLAKQKEAAKLALIQGKRFQETDTGGGK